jgi:hypothetical protein
MAVFNKKEKRKFDAMNLNEKSVFLNKKQKSVKTWDMAAKVAIGLAAGVIAITFAAPLFGAALSWSTLMGSSVLLGLTLVAKSETKNDVQEVENFIQGINNDKYNETNSEKDNEFIAQLKQETTKAVDLSKKRVKHSDKDLEEEIGIEK